MSPFENDLGATCKEEEAAKANQENKVKVSQSELEQLSTAAKNNELIEELSKELMTTRKEKDELIMLLSKKLEVTLAENEHLKNLLKATTDNEMLMKAFEDLRVQVQESLKSTTNEIFAESQAAPVSSTEGKEPTVSADAAVNVFAESQAAPVSSTEKKEPAVSADAAVNSNPHVDDVSLAQMVAGVMGNDPPVQTECTVQFRRLLSINNPPIQQVVGSGVVPRFIEFLQRDENPAIQLDAAWVLTNIASGTSEHTKVVVDAGAIPIFVRLLVSSNDDVRLQAIWALGNIAGDSPSCRDLVLQAGAMSPLLQQLHQNSNLPVLRNATRTPSNFCKGKPQPDFKMVKPSLATLAHLILSPDEEVLVDACWALSYLSDGPNEKIQAVIEAGVCRRLVELLLNPSPAVQTPALPTVGNIVTGDNLQTQSIINNNALPYLLALLSSPKKGIRKEACWTISNITAGSKDQIQAVIDNNIVPPLIQLLTNAEFDIRKEAAWAISNVASCGNAAQIRFLVQQGCIPPLCDFLTVNDAKTVAIALEGLENILKQCAKVLVAHFRHPNDSF